MAKKKETNATKASVGIAGSIFKGSAKNAPKVKPDYLGVNKKTSTSGGRGRNNASIGPKKSGGMGGPNAKIGKKEPHPGRYEEAYAENAIGGRKLAGGIKGVSKAPKVSTSVGRSATAKPKSTYPTAKNANFKQSTPKSIPKNQGTKTPATTVRKPSVKDPLGPAPTPPLPPEKPYSMPPKMARNAANRNKAKLIQHPKDEKSYAIQQRSAVARKKADSALKRQENFSDSRSTLSRQMRGAGESQRDRIPNRNPRGITGNTQAGTVSRANRNKR